MTAVLFDYPRRAAFGKVIPKTRIVARSRARGLRARLRHELADIRWAYKLAPVTINLSASKAVPEIQVIQLVLKPGVDDPGEATLRAIDKGIPSPILFEVHSRQLGLRTVAAYKRPSEADASKTVLGAYLYGEWVPVDAPRQPLPVAVDMVSLYRELLRALMSLPARRGESLQDQLDRLARVRAIASTAHARAAVQPQGGGQSPPARGPANAAGRASGGSRVRLAPSAGSQSAWP